jgi:hypothetical protein
MVEVLTDSDSPVLISNAEVMEMLNEQITKRKEKEAKQKRWRKPNNKFAHRDWIEEHVHEYLQTTPCVNIETSKLEELKSKLMTPKKKQSTGQITKMTGFCLTEAESIQLLNFMPREPVEIHLMVEELHARMSEKRQEELLELIRSNMKEGQTDQANDATKQEEVVEDVSMEVVKEEGNELATVKEEI